VVEVRDRPSPAALGGIDYARVVAGALPRIASPAVPAAGATAYNRVATADRRRVLLVATLFKMPYRVMRCAQAAGVDVCVLANPGAAALGWSRHCKGLFASNHIINGSRDEDLALEINCLARDLGAAMVLPGDAPSTRALIAIRDLLDVPCFPLPPLDQFDLLNDKWAFAQLCEKTGVRCPPTRLFADAGVLADELASGGCRYPAVAKPVGFSGSQGVVLLERNHIEAQLHRLNYRPVLLQDYIDGDDIGASVHCRAGKIIGFIAHRFERGTYTAFWDEAIYTDIGRLLGPMRVDGVFNFDMRLTPEGDVYYLECNPRFFFKIDLSMIAGVNFVGLGLVEQRDDTPVAVRARTEFCYPRTLLRSPRRWARCTRRDLALAIHALSDPVPHLLDRLSIVS
jgi:predicted ATP-grasp superfamily ATP-dependent carboligase